ncbi:MAG: hypothetical protein ABEK50_02490 [bacterium]
MSRTFTAALLLVVFGVFAAGCGGGGDNQTQTTQETAEETQQVEATGSLSATVNFDGIAPEPKTHDASGNSECGVDEIKGKSVVVNDNGTLKNVVVAVKSAPTSIDQSVEAPTVDQTDCQYKPHVSIIKSGQKVTVTDQDQGLHNIRGTRDGRQLFNEQTFKGQSKEIEIGNGGVVSLECDVHPWMQAYLYVTENGAAAVTGSEGSASLSELPAGDYTLVFWHEKYGKKTKKVTIKEDEEASVSVTFSA